MAARQRLDSELVRRGLAPSRVQADALIAAGSVLVGGAIAMKSSRLVHAGEAIVITSPARFVSRGGEKLDAALQHFGIDPVDAFALDCGASTGGFTDCLLQHGAAHVVSLDVGHGQLHPRIRHDDRVTVIERFHVRDLTVEMLGRFVDIVVADLSFISLRRVISPMVDVCRPGGDLVLLVKPQFEVGRVEASRARGVITDPILHAQSCEGVESALVASHCLIRGWMESPITGGDGNKEFLVHARKADIR
jgi:23S rRNA (cytidine1920-2'-O)/16S rRNA (cytidine1409-2'-O)-methyltransferase